jgi:hypothetical protein
MDKQKLKIAVQLYGNLRTYRDCFPNLKQYLLDHYDCDVFIHTWDTLDHNTKAWHKLNEGKEIVELNTDDIRQELVQLYNPKSVTIEKQEPKDLGNITDKVGQTYSIFGISCMMRTMKKVNTLRVRYQKENNVKYDFVLCTRPDIFLKRQFLIESFTDLFTQKELNKSIFITGCKCGADSTILNDLRYIGGKDLLYFAKPKIISSLYKNRKKVFDDVKKVAENPISLYC